MNTIIKITRKKIDNYSNNDFVKRICRRFWCYERGG